jgi:hypothetical protein
MHAGKYNKYSCTVQLQVLFIFAWWTRCSTCLGSSLHVSSNVIRHHNVMSVPRGIAVAAVWWLLYVAVAV